MINFSCPKCGQSLQSPDNMAGQPETCPQCGNVTVVPDEAFTSTTAVQVRPVPAPTPASVQQVYVTPVMPQGFVGSALGVVGIAFGAIACLSAWIPVIGCMSIPVAILGLLFGFLGLFGRSRKAMPIAAIVVSGIALLMQLFWAVIFGAAASG